MLTFVHNEEKLRNIKDKLIQWACLLQVGWTMVQCTNALRMESEVFKYNNESWLKSLSGTKLTFSSLKCGLGLLLYCCEIICLCKIKEQRQKKYNNTFRPCLLKLINNLFLIFKQYYTLFHTHFYPHIFQKTTSNIIQTLLQNGPILLQKSNSKYILSSRLHK